MLEFQKVSVTVILFRPTIPACSASRSIISHRSSAQGACQVPTCTGSLPFRYASGTTHYWPRQPQRRTTWCWSRHRKPPAQQNRREAVTWTSVLSPIRESPAQDSRGATAARPQLVVFHVPRSPLAIEGHPSRSTDTPIVSKSPGRRASTSISCRPGVASSREAAEPAASPPPQPADGALNSIRQPSDG